MSGYKTYLVALAMLIVSLCRACGLISPVEYIDLMGLLLSLGLAALRAGVSKAGRK